MRAVKWEIDRLKLLTRIVWDMLLYIALPIPLGDIIYDLGVKIDLGTFLSVFWILFLYRTVRRIFRPPMYMKEVTEDDFK